MKYIAPYKVFKFSKYELSSDGKELQFHYSFDQSLHFTEKIVLPEGQYVDEGLRETDYFKRMLELYHLVAGTSYYKLYPTKQIEAENVRFTPALSDLLNKIYCEGLGEFMYVNQLKPEHLVRFSPDTTELNTVTELELSSKPIVMIGGGKDSLVSLAALRKGQREFTAFRVNGHTLVDTQLDALQVEDRCTVKRIIDSKLLDAKNLTGALNGHVPVTAILSILALIMALIRGQSTVITSNESSADIPNLEYEGVKINHQFSKSLQMERSLREYVQSEISPSLAYFSMLRPLSELMIAKLFVDNIFHAVRGKWSSSNHNFQLRGEDQSPNWDADYSEKTLATYALLAPFLKRGEMAAEFGIDNPFQEKYKETWLRLGGQKEYKPFECVADINEVRHALWLMQRSGEYPEINDWDWTLPDYDFQQWGEHDLTGEYKELLEQLV